jgi:hypothetical protein
MATPWPSTQPSKAGRSNSDVLVDGRVFSSRSTQNRFADHFRPITTLVSVHGSLTAQAAAPAPVSRTVSTDKHGKRTKSNCNPLCMTILRSMPFAFSGLAKMIKVIRARIRALTETLGGRGVGGGCVWHCRPVSPKNANRIQNFAFGILSRPHGVSKLNETPPENTG